MITVTIQVIGQQRIMPQHKAATKWLAALYILAVALYTENFNFCLYKPGAFFIVGGVKNRRVKINNPSHSITNTFKRAILVMNHQIQKEQATWA